MHGRQDWLRWVAGVAAAVIASIVATHFSTQSQTESQIREKVSAIEAENEARWSEVLRRFESFDTQLHRIDTRYDQVLRQWAGGVDRRTGEPLPLQGQVDQLRGR